MMTLARGSMIGKPKRAPRIPTKLPNEDRASERWCQASAMRAEERIFLALIRVYQNMPSLVTMEMTAAARASLPGTVRCR